MGPSWIFLLLVQEPSTYDPTTTLIEAVNSMISMEGKNTEMFTVRLKNPKEARGSSVTVEMFPNGAKWCPVKA